MSWTHLKPSTRRLFSTLPLTLPACSTQVQSTTWVPYSATTSGATLTSGATCTCLSHIYRRLPFFCWTRTSKGLQMQLVAYMHIIYVYFITQLLNSQLTCVYCPLFTARCIKDESGWTRWLPCFAAENRCHDDGWTNGTSSVSCPHNSRQAADPFIRFLSLPPHYIYMH